MIKYLWWGFSTYRAYDWLAHMYALGLGGALGAIWATITGATWIGFVLEAVGGAALAYMALLVWQKKSDLYSPVYLRLYQLPLRKLSWDFDNYLGGTCRNGEVRISSFQPRFRINWGDGIKPSKAKISSVVTGVETDVLIECGNPYVKPSEIAFIPKSKWYSCQAFWGDSGLTKEQFLAKYDGFDFIFEYDNTKFSRRFSRGEIEFYFDEFARRSTPTPLPAPRLVS